MLSQTDINSKEQNVYADQNERGDNEGNQRHKHRTSDSPMYQSTHITKNRKQN